MFCANCGTRQNVGERFCPNCGEKFSVVTPLVSEEDKCDCKNGQQEDVLIDAHWLESTVQEGNNLIPKREIDENVVSGIAWVVEVLKAQSTRRMMVRSSLGIGTPDDNKMLQILNISSDQLSIDPYCYVDRRKKTGVVSNAIKVITMPLFDSQDAKKLRCREIQEKNKELLNKRIGEMYSTVDKPVPRIRFKFYIDANEEQRNKLKELIAKYHSAIGCSGHKYEHIVYKESEMSIEGAFNQVYTNDKIGLMESLFIDRSARQREKQLKASFLEIHDFCNSLKLTR